MDIQLPDPNMRFVAHFWTTPLSDEESRYSPFIRHNFPGPDNQLRNTCFTEMDQRKTEAPAFAGALCAITNLILSLLLVLPLFPDERRNIQIVLFERSFHIALHRLQRGCVALRTTQRGWS